MSDSQKLRFIINEYGKWFKIDDLYSNMKKYVWHIEKWSELSNEKQKKIINSYKYGIQGLESWNIDIFEEKIRILDKLSQWKAQINKVLED